MKQVTHLLAIADPSANLQPAASKAALLAARSSANLTLFVSDYDQHLSGERFFDSSALQRTRQHLIDRHRQRLQEVADTVRAEVPGAAELNISVDARWDNPRDEAILRKAAECEADWIVKDTHFHGLLHRTVFSNTDWELIRGSDKPLMLVKPTRWKDRPVIVVAVDPTHERARPAQLDLRLLETAADLTGTLDGELHIFHACDVAAAYAVSADSIAFPVSTPANGLADNLRQLHHDAFDELLDQWKTDVSYQKHFVEAETRDAMLTLVEELDADIVVMGAVSRNALQRVFLGSTAERVLDHLPCDLVVVKGSAG